jgi:hypothetical protein
MFNHSDIESFIANIENTAESEHVSFEQVLQVRETLHAEDKPHSFYTEYPMSNRIRWEC